MQTARALALFGLMFLAFGCGGVQTRVAPVDTAGMLAIAAGNGFACARDADGTVRCWGRDDAGQLGDGGGDDRPRPAVLAGMPDAIAIALGERFGCALRENGRVACWGDDEGVVPAASRGALSMLGAESHVRPVSGLANVVELAAGPTHVCARTRGGDIACWGGSSSAPRAFAALRGAAHLATGSNRVCALAANGHASCVALDVTDAAAAIAESVRDDDARTSIAVNEHRVCLANARAIRCHPFDGEPMTAELRDVTALAAYGDRQCALVASGRVACWGGGGPPSWVPELADATRISAGADHACARRRGGAVKCWGANDHGQLGNGSIE